MSPIFFSKSFIFSLKHAILCACDRPTDQTDPVAEVVHTATPGVVARPRPQLRSPRVLLCRIGAPYPP